MKHGVEAGIAQVVKALDQVHEQLPEYAVRVALEITAGQGTALGSTFDEIARIISGCRHSDRLAVCFDTCHALAAGYEFRTSDSFQAMWSEFDRIIGLDKLTVFHINDSEQDLGSHVDRHAHIGEGHIGLEPFGYFLNDSRFEKVPFLLETPKDDDPGDDIRNLEKLRGLIR
jgi:deoxyribonuclease-4